MMSVLKGLVSAVAMLALWICFFMICFGLGILLAKVMVMMLRWLA